MFTMIVVVAAFFGLVITAMSIGAWVGKPIKGSCGGLANVGLDGECGICGRSAGSCEND